MSKSSSCHDGNGSQGSGSHRRVTDEILKETEEELQNSEGILNSNHTSFTGASKGSEYGSRNTSRMCSRGASGRATREGSPAIRSGIESTGSATRDPTRPPSKFVSDSSRQGISLAVNYFQNYLKTGSPLADCSQPQSYNPDSHCITRTQYRDYIKTGNPFLGSCDFNRRQSLQYTDTSQGWSRRNTLPKKTLEIHGGTDQNASRTHYFHQAYKSRNSKSVPCKSRTSITQTGEKNIKHRYQCLLKLNPSLDIKCKPNSYGVKHSCDRKQPQINFQSMFEKCSINETTAATKYLYVCKPIAPECLDYKPQKLEYIPPSGSRGRVKTTLDGNRKTLRGQQNRRLITPLTKDQGQAGSTSGPKLIPDIGVQRGSKPTTGTAQNAQQSLRSTTTPIAKVTTALSEKQQNEQKFLGGTTNFSQTQQQQETFAKSLIPDTQQQLTSTKTFRPELAQQAPLGSSLPNDTENRGFQDPLMQNFEGGRQGSTTQHGKNVGFWGIDNQESKIDPSGRPFPNDSLIYNIGQSETERFTGKTARDQLGYMNDGIKGPSNYVDKFTDKYSPNAQGTKGPSGVSFGSTSRSSPTQESRCGSPNRSLGASKNSSRCNQSPTSALRSQINSQQGSRGLESSTECGNEFSSSFYGTLGGTDERISQRSASPGATSYHKSEKSFCSSGSPALLANSSPKCASRRAFECPKDFSASTQISTYGSRYNDQGSSTFGSMSDRISFVPQNSNQFSPEHISECPSARPQSSTGFSTTTGHTATFSTQYSESRAISPTRTGGYPTDYSETVEASARGSQYTQGSSRLFPMSEDFSSVPLSSNRFSNDQPSECTNARQNMSGFSTSSGQRPSHFGVSERFTRFAGSPIDVSEYNAPMGSIPEYAAPFSESQNHFSENANRFASSSAHFIDNLGMIPEDIDYITQKSGPFSSPTEPQYGFGTPCRNTECCGGKALKNLSRLNVEPKGGKGLSQLQGEGNSIDFLSVCDLSRRSGAAERKLPKKPELSQDEIQMLIRCETQDVELARCLVSDEKKIFKKPCPKQQKAQMGIKHLVQAHEMQSIESCPKEYEPLIHPEPDDLTPELAAAMMFSQEQSTLKMESCPADTIRHLYPEVKSPCERMGESKISVIDTSPKDEEELIEKSASVPSEGVSHSAYTASMKQKSEDLGSNQISYELDLNFGKGKREYLLVPKKPQRFNKIQYRGNDPTWFPGYFSAFPSDLGVKAIQSPSEVFNKAWITTNPSSMPATDVTVIE